MPKISIIIPVYNVEQYLRECLDSILDQTLEEIEIICVNDGSTDGSLTILEEYAQRDKRIQIIDKPNSGYGHTMNTGMDQATGEFIGIIESDDFAATEMFERLYDVAMKNDVDVVKSNYYEYISSSGTKKVIENFPKSKYDTTSSPMEDRNIFFSAPSVWSGIYKKSFLIQNNIRFLETPGASFQDTSFAFKVWSSAKKVYLMSEAFLYYRVDNMGSSVNSASKVFCVCDEFNEIEKFIDKHPFNKQELSSLVFALKFRTYKWNYQRLGAVFQYAFLLEMEEQFKKAESKELITNKYLSDTDIREVYKVINNSEEYFKETAKEYRDQRLNLSSTLNKQIYKKVFLETIINFESIVIYGAGVIGKKVFKILNEEIGIEKFVGFAVTNLEGNPETIMDLPVHSIENLTRYVNDGVILVAVKEQDQYEIINKLKSLHFKNIISIDTDHLQAIS